MYYEEVFYDNRCKNIKLMKEPVKYIKNGYIDGSCIKNNYNLIGDSDLYVKYYCVDEPAVLIYVYKDSLCTKEHMKIMIYDLFCIEVEGYYKNLFCSFEPN